MCTRVTSCGSCSNLRGPSRRFCEGFSGRSLRAALRLSSFLHAQEVTSGPAPMRERGGLPPADVCACRKLKASMPSRSAASARRYRNPSLSGCPIPAEPLPSSQRTLNNRYAVSKAEQLLLLTSNRNEMHGHEEDAPGRRTVKDPANTVVREKLQQEAERTPWVDLLSELPVLMRERCKNKQKDFEFLSSWLL